MKPKPRDLPSTLWDTLAETILPNASKVSCSALVSMSSARFCGAGRGQRRAGGHTARLAACCEAASARALMKMLAAVFLRVLGSRWLHIRRMGLSFSLL